MKKITEDFKNIQELIRKVDSLIGTPTVYHKEFARLMHKDNITRFSKQYPKCVLPINIGRTIIYAPICNRTGAEDPKMIDITRKFVDKLSGHYDKEIPEGEISIIRTKLDKLLKKYSQDLIKPTDMAAKKAAETIAFKKIKAYNDAVKTPPASEL
jgi:hypothetical protein